MARDADWPYDADTAHVGGERYFRLHPRFVNVAGATVCRYTCRPCRPRASKPATS